MVQSVLEQLLVGEISTYLGDTTPVFRKSRKNNAFSAISQQLLVGITRGFLRLQRYTLY